jgi:hypothetical protein
VVIDTGLRSTIGWKQSGRFSAKSRRPDRTDQHSTSLWHNESIRVTDSALTINGKK